MPQIEVKDEYIHVRIRDLARYGKKSFRVIAFNGGIRATIGCPKGKFKAGKCQVGTEIQKLMFPIEQFTKKEASEWMKKHPKLRLKRKK